MRSTPTRCTCNASGRRPLEFRRVRGACAASWAEGPPTRRRFGSPQSELRQHRREHGLTRVEPACEQAPAQSGSRPGPRRVIADRRPAALIAHPGGGGAHSRRHQDQAEHESLPAIQRGGEARGRAQARAPWSHAARQESRTPKHRRRPEPQSSPGCGPETRRYECCSAPSRWHFSFRLGSRNGAHGDIHRNCPVRPRRCARGLPCHRTGGGDRPCSTGPKASACSLSRMRRRVRVPAERRGPHANPLHLGVSPRPGLSRRAAHKRSRPSMSTTEESVRTLSTIRFHRNDAQS